MEAIMLKGRSLLRLLVKSHPSNGRPLRSKKWQKRRFIFKYILHVLYYSQHNSVNNRSTSRQHCHIHSSIIISHLLRCRWDEPEIMLIDYFKFSVMLKPGTCTLKFVSYFIVQVLPVLTNLCFSYLRVRLCVRTVTQYHLSTRIKKNCIALLRFAIFYLNDPAN